MMEELTDSEKRLVFFFFFFLSRIFDTFESSEKKRESFRKKNLQIFLDRYIRLTRVIKKKKKEYNDSLLSL